MVLDEIGVRELLAGVEVEKGEIAARAAACDVRCRMLTTANDELQRANRSARAHAILGPLLAGVIGTVLGALVAGVAVYVGFVGK